MADFRIGAITPPALALPGKTAAAAPASGGGGFGEALTKALGEVNELQLDARDAATAVASGRAVDTAQTVVAVEKASIALQFALQVRNKLLESYQELMRMQV